MRVLIGIKQQEAMERLLEYRKEGMEFQIVDQKDEFLFHLANNYDVVCADAGLFTDLYPWVWVDEIKRASTGALVYITLDTVTYDSAMISIIEKLALDYDFTILPAQISSEKTAYEFAKNILGFERSQDQHVEGGKFISVLPAAAADGASTVAMNTALAIASKTKLRVGLIDGNLKNPSLRSHLNISDRIKSNFQIRAKLQSGTLDPSSLEAASVVHKKFSNLYVLPGSHRRETASDVTPEMIYHLMSVARQTFHITIMDVSSFADNAATICGVRYADERWLVSQPIYTSYRISWKEWLECYWRLCGLSSKDFKLVINRLQENDKLEDMINYLDMDVAGKIPNVGGGLGVKSIHDGIPLYLQADSQIDSFNQAINQLASTIADSNSTDFVAAASEQKQPGFFRKIFQNRG
ncbi:MULTISPECIES: hypothetical protein [unclassified Paenibacillus]|uniref:AAA family ATPase n=1 Tax=unclassified Paenibacillus TaxID=185978 RepID=UPI00277E50D8|nr:MULTISPECIES: hypothetical protein [unclassified Paenibacillus]MDQ0896214.1 pilus assembly protein CpaE [Paenibacillus sp. V4I7]MDQ0913970.1 pilus assembly protein CpaE [Paenibacillus sp. V4I5]